MIKDLWTCDCLPMPDVGEKPPVISQRANELMAFLFYFSGDPKVLNPAHKEEETKKMHQSCWCIYIDMCVYI